MGKLSSEEFATFIKDLWATNIWKNKDYKVEQLIKDNGLEKLRLSLDVLLPAVTRPRNAGMSFAHPSKDLVPLQSVRF